MEFGKLYARRVEIPERVSPNESSLIGAFVPLPTRAKANGRRGAAQKPAGFLKPARNIYCLIALSGDRI
ncbi:hypothetical protein [Caproiciproducens galactitolivorans]|uniref:hypothetical protein n=1 Tax=Caproiciproducens galactitolivorans TaxID=642589 RepID=UPI0024098D2C|nr:hypothetical protein [Caproiciproducens galactitolivorans]